MADMRKDKEGDAFPQKRKLVLSSSIDETLEGKQEVGQHDQSDCNKKPKTENAAENEEDMEPAFSVDDPLVAPEDYKENGENGGEEVHFKVEAETVGVEKKAMVDKGKGILIEESEEEETDEDDDDSSSDSESDSSDGLDTDSDY